MLAIDPDVMTGATGKHVDGQAQLLIAAAALGVKGARRTTAKPTAFVPFVTHH